MRKVEWPTLGLIFLCYLGWGLAGFLIWPVAPVVALGLMTVLAALHGSLMHEVAHGHPTPWRAVNEALITWNIGLIWPFRRFRVLHLRHHVDERLTDPLEDPESFYLARYRHAEMPRGLCAVLRLNNTMLGRVLISPWLGTFGLIWGDLTLIRQGDRRVAMAWAIHLACLVPVLWIVSAMGIPLWLYPVTVAWGAAGIISIRSYAEHQWAEDPEGRTIIVESPILGWLFLHNNLHFVHHKMPRLAWYKLPGAYYGNRAGWQAGNQGYVYGCYLSMFRAHGLRAKEPVVHPALRLDRPE